MFHSLFAYLYVSSYSDVGKKLNLVYSEQRTMHRGVVLARSNSPSSSIRDSSSADRSHSLAANNRVLVVDRREGNCNEADIVVSTSLHGVGIAWWL